MQREVIKYLVDMAQATATPPLQTILSGALSSLISPRSLVRSINSSGKLSRQSADDVAR